MLTEPASKVSVPFTVVRLIRSRTPDNVFLPLVTVDRVAFSSPNVPEPTQILPDIFVIIKDPFVTFADDVGLKNK